MSGYLCSIAHIQVIRLRGGLLSLPPQTARNNVNMIGSVGLEWGKCVHHLPSFSVYFRCCLAISVRLMRLMP